jgi:protein TonB
MAYSGRLPRRQRGIAAAATLLAAALILYGLVAGLRLEIPVFVRETISAISLPAPNPPEPASVPADAPSEKAAGAASEANRRAKAAPVVAPEPRLPPPVPPPVAAAPKPASGSEASAGAAPVTGPGSGAGGRGDGLGAGGSGNGSGGGTRPVWRSGTIEDRDYPHEARRAKVGGEVEVRFTIEATGRVTGCRVSKSSGDAALDATTCRLIEARFRFKPATNAAGLAVASSYGWRQTWWLERR